MGKKLIDVTVKMGRVIPVENLNKQWNENATYLSLRIEDENGKNERYVLFTDHAMDSCPIVDAVDLPSFKFINSDNIDKLSNGKDRLEAMKSGRVYETTVFDKRFKQRRTAYLIETDVYNVGLKRWYTVVLRVALSKLNVASDRYKRDPNDAAVVGWWQDFID